MSKKRISAPAEHSGAVSPVESSGSPEADAIYARILEEIERKTLIVNSIPVPKTDAQFQELGRLWLDVHEQVLKPAEDFLKAETQSAYQTHRMLTSKRKALVEGGEAIKDAIEERMRVYRLNQERLRLEASNSLSATIAASAADYDRKIQELREEGRMREANELEQQVSAMPHATIPNVAPVVDGITESWPWSFTIDDIMPAIVSIASGKLHLMQEMSDSKGKVTHEPLVVFNEKVLRYLAARLEDKFDIPGVSVFQNVRFSRR